MHEHTTSGGVMAAVVPHCRYVVNKPVAEQNNKNNEIRE